MRVGIEKINKGYLFIPMIAVFWDDCNAFEFYVGWLAWVIHIKL